MKTFLFSSIKNRKVSASETSECLYSFPESKPKGKDKGKQTTKDLVIK